MTGTDNEIRPMGLAPKRMPDGAAALMRSGRRPRPGLLLLRNALPGPEAGDAGHEQRIALLRTRILRGMNQHGWTRLAVVPLTEGAGATSVCIDLARRIARHPATRLMLVDLDLQAPAVAGRLGIDGCASLAGALYSGADVTDADAAAARLAPLVQGHPGYPNFLILAPQGAEPDPTELLLGRRLRLGLERMAKGCHADLVLFDTSPLLESDAALAALPYADAILLVADGRRTTTADMKECERLLADMPPLMGVVLNKSES